MATQNSKKSKKNAAGKAKPVKKAAAKKPVKKAAAKAKPATKSKPAAKSIKGKSAATAKGKAKTVKPAAKPKAKPAAKPVVKAKPVAKKPAAGVKAGIAPKSGAKTKSSKPAVHVAAPKQKAVSVKQKPLPKVTTPIPVGKAPATKPNIGSKSTDLTKKPTVSTVSGSSKPNVIIKPKASPVPPFKPKTESKVKPIEKMSEKKDFKPATMSAAAEEPHKSRYSDAELQEFDQLIDAKLIIAREQLEFYLKQLEDMAENPDNKIKGLDDGLSTLESERVSSLASRQQKLIQHLENAKIRIKNKVYGICRETGKLISKERLRAVPHATLSIEAKQAQN